MKTKHLEIQSEKKFRSTQGKKFQQKDCQFTKHSVDGILGTTWDATHMTSFLNKSFYSNKSPQHNQTSENFFRASSNDKNKNIHKVEHFFRTVKDNKNVSKFGFTKINPLVSDIKLLESKKNGIQKIFQTKISKKDRHKQMEIFSHVKDQENQFKYIANSLKFRLTNPLTSRYEPQRQFNKFQKQRMKRIIQKRYPHGMVGIDHPQNPQSKFYMGHTKQIKVRKTPMCQTSFQLDRDWKCKKRSQMPIDEWKIRQSVCLRKFRNQDVHGYNIVTNRQYGS